MKPFTPTQGGAISFGIGVAAGMSIQQGRWGYAAAYLVLAVVWLLVLDYCRTPTPEAPRG